MQNVSLEHTTVTLNGHRVQGWANSADALQIPQVTLFEDEVGADGLMLISSTGMKGGSIILKLQANSPSTAYFFRQMLAQKNGAVINWEGSIENRQAGWRITMTRGGLKESPLGQTLGNAVAPPREFTFVFEVISPNYDGARTNAAPAVA